MKRREALQRVALLVGGTVVGADLFLQGCKSNTKTAKSFFSDDEIIFLDEVAETIIPKTNTPGAKDAQVGAFMNVMVSDCYTKNDQKVFKEGMREIDQRSKDGYGKKFMNLQSEQRTALLNTLNKEQYDYQQHKKQDQPDHYFKMMKELTLLGFFTSEPGATKALRYDAIPGRYDPCMPYQKGDRAWATQ